MKLLPPCLDLLRELLDERDLIRVVVEIINELRDIGEDDEGEPVVRVLSISFTSIYIILFNLE